MKTIDELKNDKGEIDSNAIKQIIPYDQPFLMVDRILTLDKTKIVAIKNTSANEPFFKGHFAGFPIMPGALIIEGMGQAATLLLRYNLDNLRLQCYYENINLGGNGSEFYRRMVLENGQEFVDNLFKLKYATAKKKKKKKKIIK